MKCFIALLLCILAVAFAAPSNSQLAMMGNRYTFDMWLAEFMPHQFLQIDATNYVKKRKVFEQNIKTILEHNAKKSSYKLGVNQWTAFTPEEVTSVLGYDRSTLFDKPNYKSAQPFVRNLKAGSLPQEVDWRKLPIAVKNQGSCGSCWAFASSSCLSAHLAIANPEGVPSLNIAQQVLVSCLKNDKQCGGTGGCSGATAELAFDFINQNGITFNEVYPYTSGSTGQDGVCKPYSGEVGVKGFVQLTDNSSHDLMEAVATKGPVSISIDASRFSLYSKGIFDTCSERDNTVTLNHAVLLMGYGRDEQLQKNYWLVQNSWGPSWGEAGYIRVYREEDGVEEVCRQDVNPGDGYACKGETDPITVCGCAGILSRSSYPIGVTYKKI